MYSHHIRIAPLCLLRRSLLAAATALGSSLLLAGVSHADDAASFMPAKQFVVPYGDLNLAVAGGVRTLYRRIESAAALVCDPVGGRAPQVLARARLCAEQAVERAVAEIDRPALTEFHANRTGRPADAFRLVASKPSP